MKLETNKQDCSLLNRLQKGFTLIELMIVVAIIGILASIALPAYQTFVAKANIVSILATATAGKIPIFQFYIENGAMPSRAEMGSNPDLKAFHTIMRTQLAGGPHDKVYFNKNNDKYVHYHINLGGINGNVNGKKIWIKYKDDGGKLYVHCQAHRTIDSKYLPKECTYEP